MLKVKQVCRFAVKWRKEPQDLSEDISVVIITKDRVQELKSTVRRLLCLPEKFSIIVVDNGSSDGTSQTISKYFPGVTVISLNKNFGSAGRNLGVVIASTPLVAFCDDDSFWIPFSLTKAIKYFKNYSRLAVLQSKILINGQAVDPNCQGMSEHKLKTNLKLPGPSILGFLACGAVVRKSAFLQVGGFNGYFGVGGEEGLLAIDLIREGWGIAYVEDVVSCHFPSRVKNFSRRRQVQVRNWLWFVWLRRPLSVVLSIFLQYFKAGLKNRDIWYGLIEALVGIPWIIKERRVVASNLETQLKSFYH